MSTVLQFISYIIYFISWSYVASMRGFHFGDDYGSVVSFLVFIIPFGIVNGLILSSVLQLLPFSAVRLGMRISCHIFLFILVLSAFRNFDSKEFISRCYTTSIFSIIFMILFVETFLGFLVYLNNEVAIPEFSRFTRYSAWVFASAAFWICSVNYFVNWTIFIL